LFKKCPFVFFKDKINLKLYSNSFEALFSTNLKKFLDFLKEDPFLMIPNAREALGSLYFINNKGINTDELLKILKENVNFMFGS